MEKPQASRAITIERVMEEHQYHLRDLIRERIPVRLESRVACDDVLQAVWVEVHKHLRHTNFKNKTHFRGWLRSIAYSRLRDAFRRALARGRRDVRVHCNSSGARALSVVGDSSRTPSSNAAVQEATTRLLEVMEFLSNRDRHIVNLYYMKGLTEHQTSRVLGLPRSTISSAILRAKKELARLMGDPLKFFDDSRHHTV